MVVGAGLDPRPGLYQYRAKAMRIAGNERKREHKGMPHWQNWSGKQRSTVDAIHFARSVDDIAAVVTQLSETPGKRLRVAGAGHSHAPLVVGADQVLDISGLSGVIATDAAHQRAKIWGGTPIYMLGRTLHDQGLALRNQGDIDRQFLAGACATGTHGSGSQLQNLSASIESMTLVDGAGRLLVEQRDAVREAQHADLLVGGADEILGRGLCLVLLLDASLVVHLQADAAGLAIGDVVAHIGGEQSRLLWYQRSLSAQLLQFHTSDVVIIKQDAKQSIRGLVVGPVDVLHQPDQVDQYLHVLLAAIQ